MIFFEGLLSFFCGNLKKQRGHMPNKVTELEDEISKLKSTVTTIQSNCDHEWKTIGVKSFGESELKETLSLASVHKNVFSLRDYMSFCVQCIKCNKIEQRPIHGVCFFCLSELGKEVETSEGSFVECSNCYIKFYWVRYFNLDIDYEPEFVDF